MVIIYTRYDDTDDNPAYSNTANKPYDEVLGAAQLIKLEIHLIV